MRRIRTGDEGYHRINPASRGVQQRGDNWESMRCAPQGAAQPASTITLLSSTLLLCDHLFTTLFALPFFINNWRKTWTHLASTYAFRPREGTISDAFDRGSLASTTLRLDHPRQRKCRCAIAGKRRIWRLLARARATMLLRYRFLARRVGCIYIGMLGINISGLEYTTVDWFFFLSSSFLFFFTMIPHSCLDTLSHPSFFCTATRQRKCYYAIAGTACWTQVWRATMLLRYRWSLPGGRNVLLFSFLFSSIFLLNFLLAPMLLSSVGCSATGGSEVGVRKQARSWSLV